MRTDQTQGPPASTGKVGQSRAPASHLPLTDWADYEVQSDEEPRPSNYRLQIAHDIRHELSTIMLLASTLMSSTDFGQQGRVRAQQLLGEARWLDELLNAYGATPTNAREGATDPQCAVRLDELADDVVKAIALSCTVQISLKTQAVSARVERLAFWRALRNVICNAMEAAGPGGTLTVRVLSVSGAAIVEVDDDGPGFDPAGPTTGSHGLAIVEDFVASCGGRLEIGRSDLGGCRARLVLPAVPSARTSDSVRHASRAV
jgi:signal transduction histidine kinase